MKNLIRSISILLLTLVSASVTYGQNTLLFKITGNGLRKPSYVFGTLNLVCSQTYKLPEPVSKAIEKCNVIYTEYELAEMEKTTKHPNFPLMMVANDDSTLDKVLTESDFKKVSEFVNDSIGGLQMETVKLFKPYSLTSVFLFKAAACFPLTSVEEILITSNKEKMNKGLESINFQLGHLIFTPIPRQAEYLLYMMKNLNKCRTDTKSTIEAYEKGDLDLVYKLMSESEAYNFINLIDIMDVRHKNWAKEMPAIMKTNSVFFAVGAGHLPGKMGVLALLKAKGYTVTPIALQ